MSNIAETSRIRVAVGDCLAVFNSIAPTEGFICLHLLHWARSCAEAADVCMRECFNSRHPSREYGSIELDERVSRISQETFQLQSEEEMPLNPDPASPPF